MPFLQPLFQSLVLPELYDWIVLTVWATILLMLAIVFFLLPGTSRTRKAWWQYVGLLFLGAISLWSIVVTYNTYQQWLNFNTHLPAHGLSAAFNHIRASYLADIQSCQFQFILIVSALGLLFCIACWQLLLVFRGKAPQARLANRERGRLWTSNTAFLIGLCCLGLSIFLTTRLYVPLIYAPQDFRFVEPTTLELIGLFIASLGGPLILLLLGINSHYSFD